MPIMVPRIKVLNFMRDAPASIFNIAKGANGRSRIAIILPNPRFDNRLLIEEIFLRDMPIMKFKPVLYPIQYEMEADISTAQMARRLPHSGPNKIPIVPINTVTGIPAIDKPINVKI